jgi:hypothetical protein
MRCRPGIVTNYERFGGPGSAVHRCALHRVRDTKLNARFSVVSKCADERWSAQIENPLPKT